MTLLSAADIARLLPLYATESVPMADKIAQAKLFTPWAGWTWFLVEYDPDQRLAWGWVIGLEQEAGYLSLDELEAIRGPGGLTIERDLFFQPIRLGDIPELSL
jgi:hypothetical protein